MNLYRFWKFYNKIVRYLKDNIELEKQALELLLNLGPLERYQFKFLLENNKEIKGKIKSTNQLEISFSRFFYGFGIIQGMNKQEISDLQDKLEQFKLNKTKKLVNVILLGITNHWVIFSLTI
jgi:hypothetical protein